MKQLPLRRETIADAYGTETFQYRIRTEGAARMRNLSPAERRIARIQGALLVGFTGLVALVTDLHGKSKRRHVLPATFRWSPEAHGWVMR